ncbi:MAG TPA: serine protease, partial [Oscillospiraceae bacterium]|nr:serine protease [Oscillospiraceae bacterium]
MESTAALSIKDQFLAMKTREDVAAILGIKEKSLRYFLFKKRPENMYHTFEIPKKNGKSRKISAPCKELKEIQKKLAHVLTFIYEPKVCA